MGHWVARWTAGCVCKCVEGSVPSCSTNNPEVVSKVRSMWHDWTKHVMFSHRNEAVSFLKNAPFQYHVPKYMVLSLWESMLSCILQTTSWIYQEIYHENYQEIYQEIIVQVVSRGSSHSFSTAKIQCRILQGAGRSYSSVACDMIVCTTA